MLGRTEIFLTVTTRKEIEYKNYSYLKVQSVDRRFGYSKDTVAL